MGKSSNFLKYLDMYGQPIQFSYRGSTVFSTSCGVVVSIIVLILIILYGAVLVNDVVSYQKPKNLMLTRTEQYPPNYLLYTDFPSLFNSSAPLLRPRRENEDTTGVMQLSIGLQDTLSFDFLPIDPRYFILRAIYYNKQGNSTIEKPIFVDLCKKFPFGSEVLSHEYELNKTFCLYTPFQTEGEIVTPTYKKLKIELSFCKNNTYVYMEKNQIKEYNRLKYIYENIVSKQKVEDFDRMYDSFEDLILQDIKKNIPINSNPITNTTNSTSKAPISKNPFKPVYVEHNFSDPNENPTVDDLNSDTFRILQETSQQISFSNIPYVDSIERLNKSHSLFGMHNYTNIDYSSFNRTNTNYSSIPNTTMNFSNYRPVVCAPQSEIKQKIATTKILFYYTNQEFNDTSLDEATYEGVRRFHMYGSSTLKKTASLYFKIDRGITHYSIIPSSISGSPGDIDHMANLNNVPEYAYGDVDDNSPFFTIDLKSAGYYNEYQRRYTDIFEILGLVGGLAKVIIIVGFVFVSLIVNLRLKESLINKFYSVIEPESLDAVSKTFDEFLKQKQQEINNKNSENSQQEQKKITIIDEYFDDQLISQLTSENVDLKEKKKYEIIYEVFKHRANSGLKFSYLEIFANIFCFCCLTRNLKLKNKVFHKANHQLENDTDFVSIIKSVQEFDNMKKSFLDEGQVNLFNSIVNDEITAEKVMKLLEEKRIKQEKKKEITDKIKVIRKTRKNFTLKSQFRANINSPNASPHKEKKDIKNEENKNLEEGVMDEKIITTDYRLYEGMKQLKESLNTITRPERSFDDVDLKLLHNLVDKKQIINEFMGERFKELKAENENKIQVSEREVMPKLTEDDIRRINKKFGKKY